MEQPESCSIPDKLTGDYELTALQNGWIKLQRGWYHPLALAYVGWTMEFKCFETAKEAVEYQMENEQMANLNEELPYVVQCKWPNSFWENIAAFNVNSAAMYYASECRKANHSLEYRVATMVDGELR